MSPPNDDHRRPRARSSPARLLTGGWSPASTFSLRGWADLAREVALWAAFAVTYEVVRWAATGRRGAALSNAETLIRAEHHLHFFIEGDVQRAILDSPRFVLHLADWTYWLAQFVVLLAAFTGVYLFRYRLYPRFRNAFFFANTVGLIVYLTIPLAPPRLFPQDGLVDTLRRFESLNLHSGLVRGLANPYAAMPSLHTADALIVGVMLCSATQRPWLRCVALAWPIWVCTALLATGNHFLLDIAAGLSLGAAAIFAAGQFSGRIGATNRSRHDSSPPSRRHQLAAARRPSGPTASRPVSSPARQRGVPPPGARRQQAAWRNEVSHPQRVIPASRGTVDPLGSTRRSLRRPAGRRSQPRSVVSTGAGASFFRMPERAPRAKLARISG